LLASRKAEKRRTDSERLSRLVLRCAMPASRKSIICFISLIVALLNAAAGSTQTIAVVGATVIDVSDFGRNASDLESAKWRYYLRLAELSPYDSCLAEYAAALVGGGAALMPTFSLLHLDRPWAANPWKDPVARLLDPVDINAPADAVTGRHTYDAAHQVAYSAVARAQMLIEEAYHRAGARYLAGSATDVWGTMPGISLHTELESLVRVGLTPREALAAATSNFTSVFFNWGRRGEIKAGWTADLLVVTEDPRTDIRNLRTIETVVLGGRIVDRVGD